MLEQVFDLDRDVVGQRRMGTMQAVRDTHRVRGPVEEIRVAKRDVLGAGGHLRIHVSQHDVLLHDPKLTVVNRHDRAVAAEMPAPAARFRVARDPGSAIAQMNGGIPVQRQQP